MHTVENPGEGLVQIFAQILMGSMLLGQNCQWRVTYFGFHCIFIQKIFENLPGGGGGYVIPPSPLIPLSASMILGSFNFN